jgi:VWFA-related protein
MKKWAICIVLAGIALPAFAANRISVAQLEQVLASSKVKQDGDLARQLSGMELTERLSLASLQQMESNLPGEKSKQALLALADVSAFLDPPSTEMPATATPDRAAQRRILAMTVQYLGKTLPLLPNIFSARDTARFESRPSQFEEPLSESNPLRLVARSRVTVLYRDGREFIDAGADKDKKPQPPDKGLATWGEFGPILGIVFIDAARSNFTWSHWELGAGGPQAVFHYSVPREKSHYELRFCCAAGSYGLGLDVLTQRVGYHGELTVDPDSGTILRVTVLADRDPGNPIAQADVAVDYGPVELAGKTYYCPIKGIALAQAPDLKALHGGLAPLASAIEAENRPTIEKASLSSAAQGPRQILLNDVTFREYHLFSVEAKVVTGEEAEAAARLPVSPAPSAPAAPAPDTAKPADEAAAADVGIPAAQSSVLALNAPPPMPGALQHPVIPEIAVTNAYGLPDSPSINLSGADNSAVTLRLTARLVDVPLVALDKKGRPITNLKPEDLEIYDEGHKVDLRAFVQAGSATPEPSSATPSKPSPQPAAPAEHAFSNHALSQLKAASPEQQQNTIVLLIDNNLSFDDLSNVREQMKTFLNGLHNDERVALYVLNPGSFRVLHEGTVDHALVAATLAKWTPSALTIAQGQEQEARNRQSMDYVDNVESLLDVNGNQQIDPSANEQPLDPKLTTLGDNPGRDAFSGFVVLARHLSSIPGHKNLVWIASDNVLADWTYANLAIDKGARIIQSSVLHAQEAMNNAHVSVYPLDASRLEAGGIDASVGNRNVEINPTVPTDPRLVATETGPEFRAGGDINLNQGHELRPGRAMAQMQQDLHPIQGVYRELADATGGRTFRRASDIVSEFNSVAADGRATYQLSFTPPEAADDKYHRITVKAVGRKDVHLQYRTGFFYRQEPTTIKDRFRNAAMEPEDATEIALTADPLPQSNGRTVKVGIAATDLEMAQHDGFWTDKLDVYLVQRAASGTKAAITGQTMSLHLKPASYQQYLREGIPFNQVLEAARGVGSIRIVVLDENSGRMGSVTMPAPAAASSQ